MSYLVIARKYRPKTFDEVVGQGHVSRTLKNAIKIGRIAHAYLFSGPRGVGKTTVARIMAKALNCENGPTPDPCNKCKMCTGINEGSVTDVYEIDGASNTGVDDIRELRDNVRYLPASGRYNIYIIDEVHMLSINAFNALLKILEEPPAHVIFIFATTEPHKIPVTILSRVQRFDFRRLSLAEITGSLSKIAKEEGIKITDGALTIISREAEGSMRDAQSLMDQVVGFAGKEVTEADVREVLGLTDRELLFRMAGALMKKDAPLTLSIVNEVYAQGYDINHYYRELLELIRNILVAKVSPEYKLEGLTAEEIDDIRGLGKDLTVDDMTILFNTLFAVEYQMRNAGDPKTLLELTLIKMTRLSDMRSIDEVLGRLSGSVPLDEKTGGATDKDYSADLFPKEGGRTVASGDAKKKVDEGPVDAAPADIAHEETGGEGESTDDNIEGFLSHLHNKNPVFHSHLINSVSFRLEDARAVISFTKESFSFNYVSDRKAIEELEGELTEYFERDIAVQVLGVNEEGDGERSRAKDGAKAAPAKKKDPYRDLIDSETAKNIFEVFNGVTVEGYDPSKK